MKQEQSKNYLFIFLLLIIIFLGPIIAAALIYKKDPVWLHQKTVNKGYLLSSRLNLHQLKLIPETSRSFDSSWFLFYLVTSPCRQLCQKNIHTLRQIILALGKNSSRVKYGVILTDDNSLTLQTLKQDSNLFFYRISKSELEKYLALLKISKNSDAYYLADPFGKIILYYPNEAPGEDMYQDLSRLLTISTTG